MFRFAHITDSHLFAPSASGHVVTPKIREKFFADACRQVASHGVDFILHTGDFVNGDQPAETHRRFKTHCDAIARELRLPLPFRFARGNHDVAIGDDVYESIYGAGTWWFAHRGWAFVGIDRYAGCYEHTRHAYGMSAESLERAAKLIESIPRDVPLIAALHDNPTGISHFHRGTDLMRALKSRDLKLLLFGHVHSSYAGRSEGVRAVTVTGDCWCGDASPLAFNVVTCGDDGTVECEFVPHAVNLGPRRARPKPSTDEVKVKLGADWLGLRGPGGTRSMLGEVSDRIPRLAWHARCPGGFGVGTPALRGETIVIATRTKGRSDDCIVRALDATSGETRWTSPLDASSEGGALIHDDRVYAGTSAGSVYCFELATGVELWRWNNGDNLPIACQPAFGADLIHLGANWEMYALDPNSGALAWRKLATPDGFTYMGPGHASPLVVGDRVFHQRTFNASEAGHGLVQSVEARSGKSLMLSSERPIMHPFFRHASPIAFNGLVWATGNGLLALDPRSPRDPVKRFDGAPCSATPAISEAGIACVSFHREIVAMDLADGRIRWRVPHEPSLLHFGGNADSKWGIGETPAGAYSSPLIVGSRAIVCDTAGFCRCFAMEDGRELWRIDVGSPIVAAPIVSGNALFFGDFDGNLHARIIA